MHLSKAKHTLRLVKSSVHPAVASTPELGARSMAETREYYRRIENYAHEIRRTKDVGAINHILDEALAETRALNEFAVSRVAPAELARAERQIDAPKKQLE